MAEVSNELDHFNLSFVLIPSLYDAQQNKVTRNLQDYRTVPKIRYSMFKWTLELKMLSPKTPHKLPVYDWLSVSSLSVSILSH